MHTNMYQFHLFTPTFSLKWRRYMEIFLVTDRPLFPTFTVFTMFPEIRVRIYLPRRLVVRCLLFPVGSVAPHLLGVLKKKNEEKSMIEWFVQQMKRLIEERRSERVNKWLNECLHACMSELIYERVTEWISQKLYLQQSISLHCCSVYFLLGAVSCIFTSSNMW